ncbi:MAG TPA: sodium/proton-translocating pyrophosphatase, partial [Tepidisphaeraceae bacterium]|nr:sodium/proton-translocating pyrophosphatase [Tepidisphaeraceae bacterium]
MQAFLKRIRRPKVLSLAGLLVAVLVAQLLFPSQAFASEAGLRLPDLNQPKFFGIGGHTLLVYGLVICGLGLIFGMVIYQQLKNAPVHASMREVSELIYETCKTYLRTQLKFILLLELFIGSVLILYFGFLAQDPISHQAGLGPMKVAIIVLFSLVGIFGSYSVAWFGIRINTFANSRAAMGSL